MLSVVPAVGSTKVPGLSGCASPVSADALPLAEIPMLREVALLIGDGKPIEEVWLGVMALGRRMGVPASATVFGVFTPSVVWSFGARMEKPLFYDVGRLHHVRPDLLAAVRAQNLEKCACGAHYEVGSACFLCVQRQDWVEIAGRFLRAKRPAIERRR